MCFSLGFLRGVLPPSPRHLRRVVLSVPGGSYTSGTSGQRGTAGPSARGAAGAAPPSGHAPASPGGYQSDGREQFKKSLC